MYSLRAAINRGETVRNVAKGFCSGFCILVAILFLIAHLDLSYGAPQALIFFFHAFIVAFQMAYTSVDLTGSTNRTASCKLHPSNQSDKF